MTFRCLWLARELPFPEDSGDRLYSSRMVQALAAASADLTFAGLARAWPAFWRLIEGDYSYWGWGYGQLAQSCCGHKMGIVDSETMTVSRPRPSSRSLWTRCGAYCAAILSTAAPVFAAAANSSRPSRQNP